MKEENFGVVNGIVFAISIVAAIIVGAYQSYKDRNKKSLFNYYYANKLISPIPIGVSMAVTFVSSLTVLGYPVLSYNHGSVILWMSVASILQFLPCYFYYIPFLHRCKLASAYHFLELRFSAWVRRMASFFQIFNYLSYMSVAVYLTSLAIEIVTSIQFHLGTVITCAVCTFYTALGGMKAVIWVDFVQAFVMIFGCVSVFVKTSVEVGGIEKIWESLENGNRTNFWTFNPDPTFTYSVWTLIFGLGVGWSSMLLCSQTLVQRLQSCNSEKDAKRALVVFQVILFVLLFNSAMNGLGMYAYFEGCDPLLSGEFKDRNQYVPYLVMKLFRDFPGMTGLFVSAAYSGMLSTVSSGQNALCNLMIEDFLRPFSSSSSNSDTRWLLVSKLLACVVGLVIMAGTFAFHALGETAAKFAFTVDGIIGGPIFGLFLAGLFLPWVTTWGAACGFLCSVVMTSSMSIGSKVYGTRGGAGMSVAPLSVETCANYTATTVITPLEVETYRPAIADTWFSVSYFYLATVGTVACAVLSLLFSLVLGRNDPKQMNPLYFIPLVNKKFFRFGVPEISTENLESTKSKEGLLNS